MRQSCSCSARSVVIGLSAIGAGLYSLSIPEDSILRYETALKTGKFVLIAHGTREETPRAREVIHRTNPEAAEDHHQPSSDAVKAEAKPKLQALRDQAAQLNKQLDEVRNATEST